MNSFMGMPVSSFTNSTSSLKKVRDLTLIGLPGDLILVAACDSLGALGPAAKEAVPTLRDLSSAPSPVQDAARKALARIEKPVPVGQ